MAPPKTLETILVVDDEAAVLRVVVAILQGANFLVLSADSGPAAIKLAEETDEPIHLLLSDVDMPGMTGPALGETLKVARPEMHVMLMSGLQDGNLLVLNYGWAFIRKPFVPTKLVAMVTDVLHSPNRSQLGGEGFDSREDTWSNRQDETRRRNDQTDANARAKANDQT
jgi:DNA-binding NtrC family response regulator